MRHYIRDCGSYFYKSMEDEEVFHYFIVNGDYYPGTNEFSDCFERVRFRNVYIQSKIFAMCLGEGI